MFSIPTLTRIKKQGVLIESEKFTVSPATLAQSLANSGFARQEPPCVGGGTDYEVLRCAGGLDGPVMRAREIPTRDRIHQIAACRQELTRQEAIVEAGGLNEKYRSTVTKGQSVHLLYRVYRGL